jgi:hypothetical protein
VASLFFLFDRAREGNDAARQLGLAALRRTSGDAQARTIDAAAEAAVHVEALALAPSEGIEKTARAAVDAALRAFDASPSMASPGEEGFMIATLARASVVLDAPGYREAATRAGTRALDRRMEANAGPLPHLDGENAAGVADVAQLVRGLLELLAATGERGWLHEAVRLQGLDDRLAGSAHDGADGDFQSGYGVAALNLVELARLTADVAYRGRAQDLLGTFAEDVAAAPLSHLTLLRAALQLDRPSRPA